MSGKLTSSHKERSFLRGRRVDAVLLGVGRPSPTGYSYVLPTYFDSNKARSMWVINLITHCLVSKTHPKKKRFGS